MARPIWTGVISFGLVAVPVRMYSATREHEVSFHQFEKGTSDRIRYQRVNERTGKEVDYADIVKGADVGGGQYVILDPDELDAVAPGRSRSLEIHAFVDLEEIDPIYYQKTYFLGPGSDESTRTYALLRDAMADAGRAAIGTLVMRGKEYLTAIRSDGDQLVLQTMFFADEVRDPGDIADIPGKVKLKPAELSMAAQLLDSMTSAWKPEEYRDTYTDRVNELIEAKKSGEEITETEAAPEATGVSDLMEVLRRSVEDARSRRGGAGRASGAASKKAAKKAPAKKSAAKKVPAKKSTARKTPAKAAAKKSTKSSTAKKSSAAKKTTAKKATRKAA
ncbi:Ku protein [Asanoa sp. WMMD1127]|uniref:non-homologous end joining protein Ku n=1 Tax=Asanoa sp. WMMD1127 TaxID=3016107 RepID=UPI0024169D57|nr:Ku protein [Asanoa sp. WMMD1127]MDG4825831.1 Ku protein [Asanoa sp. WMMD1127]